MASRGLPLVLHFQRAHLGVGTGCSPVGRGLGALRPHWASVEPSKRGGVALAAPGLTLPRRARFHVSAHPLGFHTLGLQVGLAHR